jgi:predicted transcriptional regulator
MDLEIEEVTYDILEALGSEKRAKTFVGLSEGKPRSTITEGWEISNAALQPYINDFKDLGLIETHGKNYELTRLGESVLEQIQDIEEATQFQSLVSTTETLLGEGLSYENVYRSLSDQGHGRDEIIDAIIEATEDDEVTRSELEKEL